MENRTETRPMRQSRPGPWIYPPAAETAGSRSVLETRRRRRGDGQLRRGLAWFSIGVGLAYLLAPRAMARTTGMPNWPLLMRATGVRELACGIGLLSGNTSPLLRYSRVAGDAMDLAMLGVSATMPGGNPRRLAATAALVAGVAALDVRASRQTPEYYGGSAVALQKGEEQARGAQRVEKSVAINKPADECYRMWRDLERLPRFMAHLESVRVLDERRSHWTVKGPVGTTVEWDAEITDDIPGQLLAWRSVAGAEVEHTGSVRFEPGPGGKGTLVQVQMQYQPPAGKVGAAAAKLSGEDPEKQVDENLRRFKQLIETGEVATTKGQSAGRRSLTSRLFNWGAES